MTKEEFRKLRGKDVQAAREKLRQKKEASYSDRKGIGQRVADAVSETLGLHKGNVRGRKGFIVDSRKRIERDKSIPAREIKAEEMAKLEVQDRKLAQKQKSTDKAIERSRRQRDILHGTPGRGKTEVIPREVMSKHEMERATQSRRKRREMAKGDYGGTPMTKEEVAGAISNNRSEAKLQRGYAKRAAARKARQAELAAELKAKLGKQKAARTARGIETRRGQMSGLRGGGKVEMGYKKGGSVKKSSKKSIDGIAQRGKTRAPHR